MLIKYVGMEVCMLVKNFTNMQLLLTYLRKFYVGENHQNQIFDLVWWLLDIYLNLVRTDPTPNLKLTQILI